MSAEQAQELDRFREKLDREMKSGLTGLVLLLVIHRTGPQYGYRILRTVAEASGGAVTLKEGTAYPLLKRLERDGFVTSFWGDGEGGPPRKYYQTTRLGADALACALRDWRGLVAGVERTIGALEEDS